MLKYLYLMKEHTVTLLPLSYYVPVLSTYQLITVSKVTVLLE